MPTRIRKGFERNVDAQREMFARLQRAGLNCEESEELAPDPNFEIEQTGSRCDNLATILPTNGTLFVVWVRLAVLKSGVQLCDWAAHLPWEDDFLELLGDDKNYAIPGAPEYPRNLVLNHWVGVEKSLPPEKVIEGIFLFRGNTIPEVYRGPTVDMEIQLVDQWDSVVSLAAHLGIDRTMAHTAPLRRPARATALYGKEKSAVELRNVPGRKPELEIILDGDPRAPIRGTVQ